LQLADEVVEAVARCSACFSPGSRSFIRSTSLRRDHYAVTDFGNNPKISIKPLFCFENVPENAVTDKGLIAKFAVGMVNTGV
jgi:hypothetical protein